MTTQGNTFSPDHTVIVALAILALGVPAMYYVSDAIPKDALVQGISVNLNLSTLSFVLFAGVYCLAISSRANYFFSIPLLLLNVPNAVNDLFLPFWAGPVSDIGATTVSLFTHVDIFFLTTTFILKSRSLHRSSVNIRNSKLLFGVGLILFLFSLVGWVHAAYLGEIEALMFFGNAFQVRYLLYVSLLLIYVDEFDCKCFLRGLYLASVLLVCEAEIYSYVYGSTSLTSGNFATNTFGVVLGLILLCLKEFSRKNIALFWLAAPIVLYAVISTDTRSALWALIVSLMAPPAIRRFSLGQLASIGLFLLIFIALFYADRVQQFVSVVRALNYGDDVVGRWDLSPVLTRFSLWGTTSEIIAHYPLGVGSTSFNFLKDTYGFPIPVFIDPHNDFLNTIMQHGWFGGALMISLVYFYPAILALKKSSRRMKFPISIVIFLSLTSMTNSNLSKHQFFLLAVFVTFILCVNFRVESAKKDLPSRAAKCVT